MGGGGSWGRYGAALDPAGGTQGRAAPRAPQLLRSAPWLLRTPCFCPPGLLKLPCAPPQLPRDPASAPGPAPFCHSPAPFEPHPISSLRGPRALQLGHAHNWWSRPRTVRPRPQCMAPPSIATKPRPQKMVTPPVFRPRPPCRAAPPRACSPKRPRPQTTPTWPRPRPRQSPSSRRAELTSLPYPSQLLSQAPHFRCGLPRTVPEAGAAPPSSSARDNPRSAGSSRPPLYWPLTGGARHPDF